MSAKESEIAAIKAAERSESNGYVSSQTRTTHVGSRAGFSWESELESAVKALGQEGSGEGNLVLIVSQSS